jgi:transcription antitermination factor NusG
MVAGNQFIEFPQASPLAGVDLVEHWYALQARARHERTVEQRLRERGVSTFLPVVTEIHQWSDRKKKVQMPLFSGYLFVKLARSKVSIVRVLGVEGVFRFVGSGGEGTPIPETQIDAIRSLLAGELSWSHHPFLRIGQRVRIKGGALEGVEGILTSRSGAATLVISVDAIQRSLAVRVEGYAVEAA